MKTRSGSIAACIAAMAALIGAAFAWQANHEAEKANDVSRSAVSEARKANSTAAEANEIARLANNIQTLNREPMIRVWPTVSPLDSQFLESCHGSRDPYSFVAITAPAITVRNLGARQVQLIGVEFGNDKSGFVVTPHLGGAEMKLPFVVPADSRYDLVLLSTREGPSFADSNAVVPAMQATWSDGSSSRLRLKLRFDTGDEVAFDWTAWITSPLVADFSMTCSEMINSMGTQLVAPSRPR